jgi:DNA repair protein RadD
MSDRAYQRDLIARTLVAMASGAGSVCMVTPTGSGKTHMAAEILRRCVAKGYRAVFLAHLETLLEDTQARLGAAGVYAGFVQAGRPSDPLAPIQVCSTATLHARGLAPPAQLVILDEAHRSQAATVRGVIDRFPHAVLLGLTATPQRGDGRSLGETFRALVQGPTVRELQALGHLVPIDVLSPCSGYQERGLAADPVEMLLAQGELPAIVFTETVAGADEIAGRLRARGKTADLFTGETPREERHRIRAALKAGKLDVLLSVAALVEGFDEPSIRTVVLARAFGVVGSFLQAIGRGSRPSPATGKTKCTVIDLRGSAYLHGLPDEDRRWTLDGSGVVRAEPIVALQRCPACLAVFRPQSACPRCGVATSAEHRVKRQLTKSEKLVNLSAIPQDERDRKYLATLERIAFDRIGKRGSAVQAWAMRQFQNRFGRLPDLAAMESA